MYGVHQSVYESILNYQCFVVFYCIIPNVPWTNITITPINLNLIL